MSQVLISSREHYPITQRMAKEKNYQILLNEFDRLKLKEMQADNGSFTGLIIMILGGISVGAVALSSAAINIKFITIYIEIPLTSLCGLVMCGGMATSAISIDLELTARTKRNEGFTKEDVAKLEAVQSFKMKRIL